MTVIYDNWERLVAAALRREQFLQLCFDHSRTPSDGSSSDLSISSPPCQDIVSLDFSGHGASSSSSHHLYHHQALVVESDLQEESASINKSRFRLRFFPIRFSDFSMFSPFSPWKNSIDKSQTREVLLAVVISDDRQKNKATRILATFSGIESLSIDTTMMQIRIVGDIDPVRVVQKLRKSFYSEIVYVKPIITVSNAAPQSNSSPPSRSSTLRRQGSQLMSRQRSGTSSKHVDRAEEFLFLDLVAATNDFSLENKIGTGSFGVVYKGKLPDGREVAIKRSETGAKTKKFQEKESEFESELAFLSRLHHKHLVRLVGHCEERDERLLVYEYIKNGALYDHLHNKNNVQKSSSVVNSWKVRIKISLDAARGIEYVHNYAVPPLIHRDIKSSNILLDANWTARVSDFGLSLIGPEDDRDYRPMKAVGTVGYIDPEYYGLNVLTAKSDVYGLGVVLLELLTGKRAIFKSGGGQPISVVDYAVPAIMAGELAKILDPRVGPPEANESEAVELVAYTAMHCVHLEGKGRPTMADIVANLERALALCDDSHGSISSGPISIVSD